MKTMMRFVLVCVALMLATTMAQAQVEIKAGGGMLLDPSRWGGHLSVEIPIGDTYPTYLAPFVEWYRKSDTIGNITATVNYLPAGVNLLYKAPFSERYGVVYFGIGGGILRLSGKIPDIDASGNLITVSDSATDPMVTAGGGIQFDFSETLSGFVQTRWVRAFASGSKNEVSLLAGVSFKLGEW